MNSKIFEMTDRFFAQLVVTQKPPPLQYCQNCVKRQGQVREQEAAEETAFICTVRKTLLEKSSFKFGGKFRGIPITNGIKDYTK